MATSCLENPNSNSIVSYKNSFLIKWFNSVNPADKFCKILSGGGPE